MGKTESAYRSLYFFVLNLLIMSLSMHLYALKAVNRKPSRHLICSTVYSVGQSTKSKVENLPLPLLTLMLLASPFGQFLEGRN